MIDWMAKLKTRVGFPAVSHAKRVEKKENCLFFFFFFFRCQSFI